MQIVIIFFAIAFFFIIGAMEEEKKKNKPVASKKPNTALSNISTRPSTTLSSENEEEPLGDVNPSWILEYIEIASSNHAKGIFALLISIILFPSFLAIAIVIDNEVVSPILILLCIATLLLGAFFSSTFLSSRVLWCEYRGIYACFFIDAKMKKYLYVDNIECDSGIFAEQKYIGVHKSGVEFSATQSARGKVSFQIYYRSYIANKEPRKAKEFGTLGEKNTTLPTNTRIQPPVPSSMFVDSNELKEKRSSSKPKFKTNPKWSAIIASMKVIEASADIDWTRITKLELFLFLPEDEAISFHERSDNYKNITQANIEKKLENNSKTVTYDFLNLIEQIMPFVYTGKGLK